VVALGSNKEINNLKKGIKMKLEVTIQKDTRRMTIEEASKWLSYDDKVELINDFASNLDLDTTVELDDETDYENMMVRIYLVDKKVS